MGLIGNYALLHKCPIKFMGGTTLSCEQGNFGQVGTRHHIFHGQGGIGKKTGKPSGYRHPVAWVMPKNPGGLAGKRTAEILFTQSANGALGRNIDGATTIELVPSGIGQLVVSGSGTTTIELTATGAAVAYLNANGSTTLELLGTLTASIPSPGSLQASNTITLLPTATIYALGHMTGLSDTGGSTMTENTIALAVWSYILTNTKTAEETVVSADRNAASAFAVSA